MKTLAAKFLPPEFLDLLPNWWPVVVIGIIIFVILRSLQKQRTKAIRLDPHRLALHQVMLNLGCDVSRAEELLKTYDGDANKAIMDIKMGVTAVPAYVDPNLPGFGGEIREFKVDPECLSFVDHNQQTHSFPFTGACFLAIGVLESHQRVDNQGFVDAPRGKPHAQLLLSWPEGWKRYVLNASRLNYKDLGERKQSTATRNFQLLMGDIKTHSKALLTDRSVEPFLRELKAPKYESLVEFEKAVLVSVASSDCNSGQE